MSARADMDFAASVPESLADADLALAAYGRCAADRDTRRRCGSAERYYVPGGWEAVDRRREARMPSLPLQDALVCQRALSKVPVAERAVLSVLYIPRRMPMDQQMRLLGVVARISRVRHIAGLRMFDNIRRVLLHSRPNDAVSGQRLAGRLVELWEG